MGSGLKSVAAVSVGVGLGGGVGKWVGRGLRCARSCCILSAIALRLPSCEWKGSVVVMAVLLRWSVLRASVVGALVNTVGPCVWKSEWMLSSVALDAGILKGPTSMYASSSTFS